MRGGINNNEKRNYNCSLGMLLVIGITGCGEKEQASVIDTMCTGEIFNEDNQGFWMEENV